jgi:iron complex outermembrane receptor protein
MTAFNHLPVCIMRKELTTKNCMLRQIFGSHASKPLLATTAILFLSTMPIAARAQSSDTSNLPAISVVAPASSTETQTENVSAGALGTHKQVDTPFSTVAVSSEQIADRQASSAAEVFKYDPAVSLASDNATAENAPFSIRGMPIDMLNGFKVDGQNFPSWDTDLSLEPFERVDLLKGLSGFMYGFGSPGGIVNYTLKRPTDENYRSVTVGIKSGGALTQALDLGGRFGNDDRFGYRVNLVNENGDTAQTNGHILRQVASLATDFRITPDLTWTADVLYQKRKTRGTLFGIYVGSGVAVPDADKVSDSLTQPQNYYETQLFSLGTGLNYRINKDWQASVKYRYATENRYNSDSLLYVADNDGTYYNTLYSAHTRYFYQAADAMLQGQVALGGMQHELVFGLGYQTQAKDYDNSTGWNDGYSLGIGNMYQTTLLSNSDVATNYNLYRYSKITQASVYASDTVHLTDRWSVLAGLRYNQYRETVFDTDGAQASRYTANPVTPTLALMYKTDPDSTVYVSYVEALEEGGSAANTNANYPTTYGPLKSKQMEVGYKTEHKSWGTNAALFQVRQGYNYTNSANVFVQDGIMRYQGLELSGWFAPAREWKLMGGVMLLNTRAQVDDADINGKRVYGAPHLVGTSRLEYQPAMLSGITLALGAKYVSDVAVDASNEHILPSYTTYDLSAKYQTRLGGRDVVFRASINNLFDKHYWTTAYGYYILPGATRSAQLTATVNF